MLRENPMQRLKTGRRARVASPARGCRWPRFRSGRNGHAITVAGLTRTGGERQSRQTFESATQNVLSPGLSRGRFWVRVQAASCCRRARFSRAGERRDVRTARRTRPEGTDEEPSPSDQQAAHPAVALGIQSLLASAKLLLLLLARYLLFCGACAGRSPVCWRYRSSWDVWGRSSTCAAAVMVDSAAATLAIPWAAFWRFSKAWPR